MENLVSGTYKFAIHWGKYSYMAVPGRTGKYAVALARYYKTFEFNIN